jgi:integrase
MAARIGKLASNILSTAKPGKHSDGGGLYLYLHSRDEKNRPVGSWVYRYTFAGARTEMGIGSIDSLSLKDARTERDRLDRQKREGINPREAREQAQRAAQERREAPTLTEVAESAFEAHKATLKGTSNEGRWYSPLRLHLLPKIGDRKIEDITQHDIASALRPIWTTKYPTAKKVLDRLSVVLNHAEADDLDVDPRIIAKARKKLGASGHEVKNHPALPLAETVRLFHSLDIESNVDRALALYLLAGAGPRIGPLRNARANHIQGDVWTFPAEAMKGRKGKTDELRLPITDQMKPIIERCLADCRGGYLFSTKRDGASLNRKPTVVSDQAIENVMRAREEEWSWAEPCRPHGLRATFRTWAAETNPSLFAVAEASLAHKVGSTLERTYNRTDFLEQRRSLLGCWGAFLASEQHQTEGKVIRLQNHT